MSSTEQKNVTQPFINSCFGFGILPTLLSRAFCDFSLSTDDEPFESLGDTANLGTRCRNAEDPVVEAQVILPILDAAPGFTRSSPLLLWLCHDATVYAGNQAVLRFVEGVLVRRWNLFFNETGAYKHATQTTAGVGSFLAPAAYGDLRRHDSNYGKVSCPKESRIYRIAAEAVNFLANNTNHADHERQLKSWCNDAREAFDIRPSYRTASGAVEAYLNYNREAAATLDPPPELKQKLIYGSKNGKVKFRTYYAKGVYYFKVNHKYEHKGVNNLTSFDTVKGRQRSARKMKGGGELYVLSHRDMQDIEYLLTAAGCIKTYYHRRCRDAVSKDMLKKLKRLQANMWSLYTEVMGHCGFDFSLRNKLGVFFDVLQWRYLAWRSGNIFYNHSAIMKKKINAKGLDTLPSQDSVLRELQACPIDVAVDMLGIYKASIYPEVDPFKVVCDQLKLHRARFRTDWPEGSPERERMNDTKSYMWYLGVRMLHSRFKTWPGRIRAGVEPKSWHDNYRRNGIPGGSWRDGHDIDLTGVLVTADINDEYYFKQQDSACAPPLHREYRNFEAMRKAPRKHRRKLLYAIQEQTLEPLSEYFEELNQIGRGLPDGYVGTINYKVPFSTDIVTGSRSERHKDAPRPFYAASPPWGCIVSYIDGITRDFLSHVPQSMLGKSTRQKFSDLGSTAGDKMYEASTFYMSDDKAKYSPKMDPNSQQLPADFFAELFDKPAIKAFGPVMYHCELYYRVHGHLVHYNSNGTDREGMRGASNTWLEIVAQGLSTRLSRERGLVRGKSIFLSFIDDGLRKFSIADKGLTVDQTHAAARLVIEDVIFGLRVLGRELSWDKTFISHDMFVILNELVIDGAFISSGLKSYCTLGDLEMKEVMTASDYEQLYFGKMRGAFGVGAPIDLCHNTYIFEVALSHYRMGVNLQNNKKISKLDYRLFCATPIALGGAGLRSQLQMACNEVASATKEGIGSLIRLSLDFPIMATCVASILNQKFSPLDPVDFMRDPEQFHVADPRIKTQRMAAEVRQCLREMARNELSRSYIERDAAGMELMRKMGRLLMTIGDVNAVEVRLLYSSSPIAFIDEFVQKLASSSTLAEMISRSTIKRLRRTVRRDLVLSAEHFHVRCRSRDVARVATGDLGRLAMFDALSR